MTTEHLDLLWISICIDHPNPALFSSVQLLSRVWLFATPWTAARQASLSITNSQSLLNSCSSSRWCHPVISSSVVSFSLQSCRASGSFPVGQFFTSGGQSVGQFSISHSNEHSGLISFRMDWFDLLAVQGTLRNLLQQLQFKSISSSVLSFIYGPTLTPYMTTGKTILWLDGPLLAK